MSFSSFSHDSLHSDINVTPFVDVLLVLLVIFMVTAPILHHTLQIELPKDQYSDGARLEKPLRLVVNKQGMIYLNQKKLGTTLSGKSLEFFQKAIEDWKESNSKSIAPIDLEADSNVKYGVLAPIIARVKESGAQLNLIIMPK